MMRRISTAIFIAVIIITGAVFAWRGIAMHQEALVAEAELVELQALYWSVSEGARASAGTDSELALNRASIEMKETRLADLRAVGLGHMLTGIFVLLLGILVVLMMLPRRMREAAVEKQR